MKRSRRTIEGRACVQMGEGRDTSYQGGLDDRVGWGWGLRVRESTFHFSARESKDIMRGGEKWLHQRGVS